MAQRHEDERRQEDPERGEGCARDATQHVADERRRREDRTGGDLADGDGVEELLVGQPAEAIDEIVAKEGQEHVAASVERSEERRVGKGGRSRRWPEEDNKKSET